MSWKTHAVLAILGAALPALPASAIDLAAARRAVAATVATVPGDDARFDARGRHVRVADLDGDGVDEIVYLGIETCVGFASDCPNALTVMTALKPDDARARPVSPGLSPELDAQMAAVRDSGYAEDASTQIPGVVSRIDIAGRQVSVTFVASRDSDTCRRSVDRGAAPPCPAPGRHRWRYAWTPRALIRVDPPPR